MPPNWSDDIKKEMLDSLFKTNSKEFNRCLEPTLTCRNKAIHAHSVQNSRILDNIVMNDHVSAFKRKIDKDKGPQIDYGLVGRNSATTFTGLCETHDNSIFSPIEDNVVNLKDEFHLFLLSYRVVYRELHATMEGAMKIQSGYIKRVELGLDPESEPSEVGMAATRSMYTAWITHKYKREFDIAYISKTYNSICHDTFIFELDNPTIAVSSLFSIENHSVDNDQLRVALNVLPITKKQTYVVLSYREKDAAHARSVLDRVINSRGMYQKYELSRFILNHCENFVMSPLYVNLWSDKKKEIIKQYYIKTILSSDLDYESPDLYLF